MNLRKSYRLRLLVVILSTTILIFLSVFIFYMIHYNKRTTNDAKQLADAFVRENANRISAEFNIDMGMSRTLARSVVAMHGFHSEGKWDEYKAVHREMYNQSTGFLNVWSSFELSAFREGYPFNYGRRVINAYSENHIDKFKDYYNDMDGDNVTSNYYYLKQLKEESIVEPYMYSLSGKKEDEKLVTSLCVPILEHGKFIGLSGVDIGLDRFQRITDSIKPFEDSYSVLIAYDGRIITHPDPKKVNLNASEVYPEIYTDHQLLEQIQHGSKFSFIHEDDGKQLYYSFAPIQIGASKTPWSLVVVTNMHTINKVGYQFIGRATLIMILGLILIAIIIYVIVNKLIVNIDSFILFTKRINDGDLTAELHMQRDDEIGTLATALKTMANSLRVIVTDIQRQTRELENTSKLLTNNSKQLSQSSTQQAAEVEEISASLEQMVHFIEQNADHAGKTNIIALKSKEGIELGSNSWEEASAKIDEISTLNHQIADIAFQTNILALNAAVEAARAGDQGRGFAVVAGEVRRLAESSKQAAENIQHLSKEVLDKSANLSSNLREIVPSIEMTSQLVSEIDQASREQKEGVSQINLSIRELNNIAQINAESSESMSEYANQLSEYAARLSHVADRFKV